MAQEAERREFVRYWLKLAGQMREITGTAEWSDMPAGEVEQVRAAYGMVKKYAGHLFSCRETVVGDAVREARYQQALAQLTEMVGSPGRGEKRIFGPIGSGDTANRQ